MVLISVGKYQYIQDDRFKIIHEAHSHDWILRIQAVDYDDAGMYECQVNTEPMRRRAIYLNVVGESRNLGYFSEMCDSVESNRIAIPKWESESESSNLGIETIPIPVVILTPVRYFQLLCSKTHTLGQIFVQVN